MNSKDTVEPLFSREFTRACFRNKSNIDDAICEIIQKTLYLFFIKFRIFKAQVIFIPSKIMTFTAIHQNRVTRLLNAKLKHEIDCIFNNLINFKIIQINKK